MFHQQIHERGLAILKCLFNVSAKVIDFIHGAIDVNKKTIGLKLLGTCDHNLMRIIAIIVFK